ncbi:MAG: CoA-binding protein [Candidatus Eiseniibacteriota bacterium]
MSPPTIPELIDQFLAAGPYAVVGASQDRSKYGNKVLRAYQQRGLEVYPVNPRAATVEGLEAYADLASLPVRVRGISIITPPSITEKVVSEAVAAGVEFVWMQPGSESPAAVRRAEEGGLGVIADGSCFLVVTGFRDEA